MNNFKTSEYPAGTVLTLKFSGKADEDSYGNINYVVLHEGERKTWKLKPTDSRCELLDRMSLDQMFRIVMKDTGRKYAFAEIKPIDGEIPEVQYSEKDLQPVREAEKKTEELIGEKPDWDAIARGKVRNSVAVAYIEIHKGDLSESVKKEMSRWVDWIMTEL